MSFLLYQSGRGLTLQNAPRWPNSLVKRRKIFPPRSTCTEQPIFTDQVEGIKGQEACLRESGLFSLEERRLQGDLRTAFQYLKWSVRKLEIDLLEALVGTGQGRMALS